VGRRDEREAYPKHIRSSLAAEVEKASEDLAAHTDESRSGAGRAP
jgi:hypothetical protein